MKYYFLLLSGIFLVNISNAQKIAKIILVGEKGITQNMKEAKTIVVVKVYPDRSFERKDYIVHGALKMTRTYSDSSLKVLHGMYCTYWSNGFIKELGYYAGNKKVSYWLQFNDSGRNVAVEKYAEDITTPLTEKDTIKNMKGLGTKEGDEEDIYTQVGEKPAQFRGGNVAMKKFIRKHMDADVILKAAKPGQVRVGYTVSTTGKVEDIYLHKSAEFVLDEEAIRVISKMPAWEPGEIAGVKVKAYRIQPFSWDVFLD